MISSKQLLLTISALTCVFSQTQILRLSQLTTDSPYRDIYDIPISEQNYTDSHNKTHPIWAKPLFNKEYKSLDDLFFGDEPLTSIGINKKFVAPHVRCLHTCYSDYTRNSFADSPSKDGESPELTAIKKYGKCKIECYKQ